MMPSSRTCCIKCPPPAIIITGLVDDQVCDALECADLAHDYPQAVLDLPDHITAQTRKVWAEGCKGSAIHRANSKEHVLCSAQRRFIHK